MSIITEFQLLVTLTKNTSYSAPKAAGTRKFFVEILRYPMSTENQPFAELLRVSYLSRIEIAPVHHFAIIFAADSITLSTYLLKREHNKFCHAERYT